MAGAGERTRLACSLRRPRRNLFGQKFAMARAPSPAREGACAPQTFSSGGRGFGRLRHRSLKLRLLEFEAKIFGVKRLDSIEVVGR